MMHLALSVATWQQCTNTLQLHIVPQGSCADTVVDIATTEWYFHLYFMLGMIAVSCHVGHSIMLHAIVMT